MTRIYRTNGAVVGALAGGELANPVAPGMVVTRIMMAAAQVRSVVAAFARRAQRPDRVTCSIAIHIVARAHSIARVARMPSPGLVAAVSPECWFRGSGVRRDRKQEAHGKRSRNWHGSIPACERFRSPEGR